MLSRDFSLKAATTFAALSFLLGAVFMKMPAFAMEEEGGEPEPRGLNVPQSFNDGDALGPTWLEDSAFFDTEAKSLFRVIKKATKLKEQGQEQKAVRIYLRALQKDSPLTESRLLAYQLAQLIDGGLSDKRNPPIQISDEENQFLVQQKIQATMYFSLFLQNTKEDPFYTHKDEVMFELYFHLIRNIRRFKMSQTSLTNLAREVGRFDKIQKRIMRALETDLSDPEKVQDIPPYIFRLIGLSHKKMFGPSRKINRIKFIETAAKYGDKKAQLILSQLCNECEGVQQDSDEILKYCRLRALQGDTKAQNALGFFYDKGQYVEHNPALAEKWYKKAADQGNSAAQASLKVLQERMKMAIELFKKAADQGYTEAQLALEKINQQYEMVKQQEKENASYQ
ncbi:MAG: hypothetical protein BGO67_02910 [Alphaproteobacteria bacterium 41-28]|nr:MAG: hypothetical protein BGO67_02910 [Alphaproteobacteria bacterium 41-28]